MGSWPRCWWASVSPSPGRGLGPACRRDSSAGAGSPETRRCRRRPGGWSAGVTAARAMTACHSRATSSEPNRAAASSPSRPLLSGTIGSGPAPAPAARSSRASAWPRTLRRLRRSRKARSLFMTGPMAWARSASLSASYQAQNGPSATGSSTRPTSRRRKPASVSSSGTSHKRHARLADQRQQRGPQDVVGARSPGWPSTGCAGCRRSGRPTAPRSRPGRRAG